MTREPLVEQESGSEDVLGERSRTPTARAHICPRHPTRELQNRLAAVTADGNHLRAGVEPFRVRGVTYGTFLPRRDGEPFPETGQVKADFAAMAALGLNTVRLYTLPPADVLEQAEEAGLLLIIGVHYEDWRNAVSVGRRTNRRVLEAGLRAVEDTMARCAGRPNVLAVSVGNEVPGDVVRLHGIGAVEDTLSALIEAIHRAVPQMLCTYTNYPTTEYLKVAGQDLATFNVFLEEPGAYRRYLRHLQTVTDNIPLVLTEVGLAGDLHGEKRQAATLAWQLRTLEETGCAGATVYAWTDEWGVDGQAVDGWGFGITDVERRSKPAVEAVRRWARGSITDLRQTWPRVSVVVCAYNEERRLRDCLASLERVRYPDIEVIVCDDGSTDATLAVAREFPFTVLALDHAGLSVARNAGMNAATGQIVAYLDADAVCHPEWPYFLALSLEDPGVVATGGPNLPFPDAALVERAVALSPGNPQHVLISDDRAEHVPGCNMAFHKAALQAIGGFDPIFAAAGDDVDVCWRLLDSGGEIAFSPAAQVYHHRRDTFRGYLRQQKGYGRAERILSGRHRHRFNRLGQARWNGFIYGGARAFARLLRPVIYHGTLGAAPYQSIARRPAETVLAQVQAWLPLTVPLAVVGLVLSFVSAWGLLVAGFALVVQFELALAVALAVPMVTPEHRRLSLRALVALLHVVQPPWRAFARLGARPAPFRAERQAWTGDRLDWLAKLRRYLARVGCTVRASSPTASSDLLVRVGPLAEASITVAVVWGWQPTWRLRVRPRSATFLLTGAGILLMVADQPHLGLAAAGVMLLFGLECGLLVHRLKRAVLVTTAGARGGPER